MTYDLEWTERVKSEFWELWKKITRLQAFLYGEPSDVYSSIDKQDILLLKEQLGVMREYAGILLTRLYYHHIEIDKGDKDV